MSTLAGFLSAFFTIHRRFPSKQEVFDEGVREGAARATAEQSTEATVPYSLYVAGCRDFERVAARCDDAAEIIAALQKALAYWMPKVFDDRSAHDAYLLMGYNGEDEPSYWDTKQSTDALYTMDQMREFADNFYLSQLQILVAEKEAYERHAPKADRDSVIEECAKVCDNAEVSYNVAVRKETASFLALMIRALKSQQDAAIESKPAEQSEDRPVEIWRGVRKVTIHSDCVLRVWGENIATEMSDEPRTLQSVQEAVDWLYIDAAIESHGNV